MPRNYSPAEILRLSPISNSDFCSAVAIAIARHPVAMNFAKSINQIEKT